MYNGALEQHPDGGGSDPAAAEEIRTVTRHSNLELAGNDPPTPIRAMARNLRDDTHHAVKVPRMLACVDNTPIAHLVAAHAVSIARSLGLELTLARVLREGGRSVRPVDPIEWQLQRQENRSQLRDLTAEFVDTRRPCEALLSGDPGEELIDWCDANGATMLALGTRNRTGHRAMGSTMLRLLEHGSMSLLLVPQQARKTSKYRRILVPIDGSSRAESVIPVARIIARAHGAELLLMHVVPPVHSPSGTQTAQATNLHSEIERQNARGARDHLEQLRLRAQDGGIAVRSEVRGPADPRHAICQFVEERDIDLVVMSSHGATALNDVPCGSVAEYLATHSTVPVVMVRPNLVTGFGGDAIESNGQSVFRFG